MRKFFEKCKESKVVLRMWTDGIEECSHMRIKHIMLDSKGDVLGLLTYTDDEDHLYYVSLESLDDFAVLRYDHLVENAGEDLTDNFDFLLGDLSN